MTRWRRREGGGSCRGGRASRGRRNRRRRTSEVADRGVERPLDRIRLDDLQVRLLDDERRGFGDARRGEDGEEEEEEEDRPWRGARRGRGAARSTRLVDATATTTATTATTTPPRRERRRRAVAWRRLVAARAAGECDGARVVVVRPRYRGVSVSEKTDRTRRTKQNQTETLTRR
jgi:hypothetical protein